MHETQVIQQFNQYLPSLEMVHFRSYIDPPLSFYTAQPSSLLCNNHLYVQRADSSISNYMLSSGLALVIRLVAPNLISKQATSEEWLHTMKAQNITEQIDKIHSSVHQIVQKLECQKLVDNPWIFTDQDVDFWTNEFIKCYKTHAIGV
jgi:hypothetical protein